MDDQQVHQLMAADRFDHPVGALRLLETHISWVLLTGEWAYKIKKPVDFGFLDFSSLDKRKYCCEEELRLNRRLCPQIYHAVVPVCQGPEGINLKGSGVILDHAVKMRQFDPEAILSRLLPTGQVEINAFRQLGYGVAAFHESAAVAPSDSPWGTMPAVTAPVRENFIQIEPLLTLQDDRDLLMQLSERANVQGGVLEALFYQRRQRGFIRELHGDLHTGNIALIDGEWLPFDCIEFNPSLRWIDTASDVAFLLMDLEYLGYSAQANRFLNAYLEYSGDLDLLPLLPYYKAYRAMVRAKVNQLRLQQPHLEEGALQQLKREFDGYLQFCQGLASGSRPFLALMMGVSGSGKSTVAQQVAETTGAIHLRSDVVRKRLFGLKPNQASGSGVGGGIYTSEASRRTFSQLREDARRVLEWGLPVIVDATFLSVAGRFPFRELANACGVPFAIISCEAEPAELERRILQRQQEQDASEADIAVLHNQLDQVEALTQDEQACRLDSRSLSVGELARLLIQGNPH